jgi:GT2 family glycosyltransferase
MENYSITIAVQNENMIAPAVSKLQTLPYNVLIGKDYPSFSKLVNTVIVNSKTEIVIFCSHRVRPTPQDINKILSLLKEGYGLVGLYRFAFFGLRKELIRKIGFMDERFTGGGYEDLDFVFRLKEADIAYYESESAEYYAGQTTWNHSLTPNIFSFKWEVGRSTITRLKNELSYDYDLGINPLKETEIIFLPWNKSYTDSKILSFCGHYNNYIIIKK